MLLFSHQLIISIVHCSRWSQDRLQFLWIGRFPQEGNKNKTEDNTHTLHPPPTNNIYFNVKPCAGWEFLRLCSSRHLLILSPSTYILNIGTNLKFQLFPRTPSVRFSFLCALLPTFFLILSFLISHFRLHYPGMFTAVSSLSPFVCTSVTTCYYSNQVRSNVKTTTTTTTTTTTPTTICAAVIYFNCSYGQGGDMEFKCQLLASIV